MPRRETVLGDTFNHIDIARPEAVPLCKDQAVNWYFDEGRPVL